MNIQLSQVLSDVTGATGQTIIRAIVAGERNPHELAALRNYRCKKDEDELARSLRMDEFARRWGMGAAR